MHPFPVLCSRFWWLKQEQLSLMPILKQELNLAEPVDTSRQDKFGRWRESCIWQALSEYQWKLHADMNLQCCSTLKSDYMITIPFLKYTPCLISGITSHLVRMLWFFLIFIFCMWKQNMLPRVADEHTRINITRQTINCRDSLKLWDGALWMQLCKNTAQGRKAKKITAFFCLFFFLWKQTSRRPPFPNFWLIL